VLDAPNAAKVLVTATLEGSAGPSIWIVDCTQESVDWRAYPLIDGTLAADVVFAGTRIGEQALLLGPELAPEALEDALDRVVLARVAEALGIMKTVMDLSAEHLRTRTQFGQPLASFQALQHRMAEMFVEVQETRSILYRAIASLNGPSDDRRSAVSAAKIVATAAARVVGGQGIQLHGAIGMTEEYPIGHCFKRLVALEKAFGDGEYHLARLAESYR
jgi:alkylation response protein AidB-like acyl-CoA dehydrogenase